MLRSAACSPSVEVTRCRRTLAGALAAGLAVPVVLLASATPAAAATDTRLFGVSLAQGGTPSAVYTIDESTGATTKLPTALPFNTYTLARQPGTDLLYFYEYGTPQTPNRYRAATYNVVTNTVQELGGWADVPMARLAFAPDGKLYGMSGSDLIEFDPSTGMKLGARTLSVIPGDSVSSPTGDIAFAPDGTLFVVTSKALYSVAPGTSVGRSLGLTGSASTAQTGLGFGAGGVLFSTAHTANQVEKLDVTTGAATRLAATTPLFTDLASQTNRLPMGSVPTATAVAGHPLTIPVLDSFTDPDGDQLSILSASTTNGSAVVSGRSVVYTPAAAGPSTLTYTVTDGLGGTVTGTVSVGVTPNQVPEWSTLADRETLAPGGLPTALSATDADRDTVTFSVAQGTLPPGVQLLPNGTFTGATSTSGQYSAQLVADDGFGGRALRSVAFFVPNGAPVVDVGYPTFQKIPYGGTPAPLSAADPNGDTVSYEVVSGLPAGLGLSAQGVFTGAATASGPYELLVRLTDGLGGVTQLTISGTVGVQNTAPTAVVDEQVTSANTPVTVDVLGNDTDPQLDLLTVSSYDETTLQHGTVTTTSTGALLYTPPPGYSGTDSFSYTVRDVAGLTSTAEASVLVRPVAVEDAVRVQSGSAVTFNLVANDLGTSMTFGVLTTGASHGALGVGRDGRATYVPFRGFSGTDVFTYRASDKYGNLAYGVVRITVTSSSTRDEARTDSGSPVVVDVLANDLGAFDPATLEVVGQVRGVATITAPGVITYTPASDFSGTELIAYRVEDTEGNERTGVLTVTVAPVAVDDVRTTVAGSALSIDPFDNDRGSLSARRLVVTRQPVGGRATPRPDGSVDYLPRLDFTGEDTIGYELTDDNGVTSRAMVTVTVTSAAMDDLADVDSGGAVTTSVRANDLGAFGRDGFTVTQPQHGRALPNPDGTVTYAADPTYSGSDSYTYTVTDVTGAERTATVAVTVRPLALADDVTVAAETELLVDPLGNDRGSLVPGSLEVLDPPSAGTLSFRDGKAYYLPYADFSGTDRFTYRVRDKEGTPTEATATIVVTPTATPDEVVTTSTQTVVVPVLGNDAGRFDPTTLRLVGQPRGGTATADQDGTITYTSGVHFSGVDELSYEVLDREGRRTGSTLRVDVRGVARPDATSTQAGQPVTVNVLDDDLGAPVRSTLLVERSPYADVVADANGNVTYTPKPGFSGTDSVEYTVLDPADRPTWGTLTVTVTPVALTDHLTVDAGRERTVDVLDGDLGDLDPATLAVTVQPLHGEATVVAGKIRYTADGDHSGPDAFTYTVEDRAGQLATGTVQVDVDPVAVADSAVLAAGSEAGIAVLQNDRGSLSPKTLAVSDPARGSVTVDGGVVTYTPDAGFSGTETFSYVVDDTTGQPTGSTVTVTVTPVAVDDTAEAVAGSPVLLKPYANDLGDLGSAAVTTTTTDPAHGELAVVPGPMGGGFLYTPEPGFSGTDSFTYTVVDAAGRPSTATVTITVEPLAVPDVVAVDSGVPSSLDVLDGDLGDLDPATLTVTVQPVHGSATVLDGRVVYTADDDYSGPDTLTYSIADRAGQSVTGTVSVDVRPLALADETSVGAGSTVAVPVLDNDFGSLSPQTLVVADPAHGTVALGGGVLRYTPDDRFSGTETFSYAVKDTSGKVTGSTVTVDVTPVLEDDVAEVEAGSAVEVSVLGNDLGGFDPASVEVGDPANGSVTVDPASGVVRYTPDAGFSGTDTFSYSVVDAGGRPGTAEVSVTVLPVAKTGTEPVAQAGGAVVLDVLADDLGSLDPATVVVTGVPKHGRTSVAGGRITYVPTDGFSGTDTFTYEVADRAGQRTSAVITVTVLPTAAADAVTGSAGAGPITVRVLDNDKGYLDPTSIIVTGSPARGTVAVGRDGTLVYTPRTGQSGSDSFTYTVADGEGGRSAPATVTVKVVGAPVADAGSSGAGSAVEVDLLANDSGSYDASTLRIASQPRHGTVTLRAGRAVYTPDAGWSGPDTFTYEVTDSTGTVVSAGVTITTVPVAARDAARTTGTVPLVLDVLGNDLGDLDRATLRVTAVRGGSAVIGADGRVTFTPAADAGPDAGFSYVVADRSGGTTGADVAVAVSAALVAEPDEVTATAGRPLVIDVLGNDSEGLDPSTVTITAPPQHGTLEVLADGTIRYTPAPGYTGPDRFSYSVLGADGVARTAEVRLDVAAAGAVVETPTALPVGAPVAPTAATPTSVAPTAFAPTAATPTRATRSASTRSADTAGQLARTGTDSGELAGLGVMAVLAGIGAVLTGRRRRV